MNPVFTDWPENAAEDFGRRPLLLKHGVTNSALFTDEALVKLIEGGLSR
jgi:hypothetical protein